MESLFAEALKTMGPVGGPLFVIVLLQFALGYYERKQWLETPSQRERLATTLEHIKSMLEMLCEAKMKGK